MEPGGAQDLKIRRASPACPFSLVHNLSPNVPATCEYSTLLLLTLRSSAWSPGRPRRRVACSSRGNILCLPLPQRSCDRRPTASDLVLWWKESRACDSAWAGPDVSRRSPSGAIFLRFHFHSDASILRRSGFSTTDCSWQCELELAQRARDSTWKGVFCDQLVSAACEGEQSSAFGSGVRRLRQYNQILQQHTSEITLLINDLYHLLLLDPTVVPRRHPIVHNPRIGESDHRLMRDVRVGETRDRLMQDGLKDKGGGLEEGGRRGVRLGERGRGEGGMGRVEVDEDVRLFYRCCS